jgi:hypothetical protein
MAYVQGGRKTFKAGGDLSALQYTGVKLNSSGNAIAATAATDKVIGFVQNAPATNDSADVALRNSGGTFKAKAGGTIAVGDLLTIDASGRVITTTTAANEVVGRAIEAAVVNQITEVLAAQDRY